jgi:hypothetical protein
VMEGPSSPLQADRRGAVTTRAARAASALFFTGVRLLIA